MTTRRLFALLAPFGVLAACVAAPLSGCGGPSKLPPVALRAPASGSGSASVAKPPMKPGSIPATSLGTFSEGTFGPRVVRAGKRAIVVSAPRSESGRRWMASALDENDKLSPEKHELGEAPEDASAWDVKAIGDGFLLAWTRPTEVGQVLYAVSIAADGSPRGAPVTAAKSGDDLVAVRIVPMEGSGALLTYGEKTLPKGSTSAMGALYAVPFDSLGRKTGDPMRVAEKLSAWQVVSSGGGTAMAALVQRVDAKADAKMTPRDELARVAKAVGISISTKGLAISDAITLSGDDVVPEIDVVMTGPSRALVVWSDRREVDAHLFASAIDTGAGKPKPIGNAKRSTPPRGEQGLVAMVPMGAGAAILYETISPRSIRDPRRRFEIALLTGEGEASATPRGFLYPFEDDEPELAKSAEDEIAVLTYARTCVDANSCDAQDLRPWVIRFGGPTLAPKQTDLIDVGDPAQHAFDLSCSPSNAGRCDLVVEGTGNPANLWLAKIATHKADAKSAFVYRDLAETIAGPPRLEAATAIAKDPEFTGLRATRAGNGTLVSWITWAPDDAEVEASVEDPKPKKSDKSKKDQEPKKKPPKKKGNPETLGAHVAVRLLDASGEPLAPVTTISERALSKGNVAAAWGAGEKDGGVVAYVSRAEGDEEVYAAHVDAKGGKAGKSSRITHAPGAASDVALTALPEGGFLLAWIESRGKNAAPAVYAVKLDKGGGKVGGEVKIGGGAGGDLSDLALATIGGGTTGARVIATWSDARDDATHGFGDVWFTIVGAKNIAPVVAEKVLARSKTHSHHPSVTARGDGGAVFAWLEDDPSVSEALELTGKPDWGTYVARIDASGNVTQQPTQIPLDPTIGKGLATSVSIDCPTGNGSCRAAIAWAVREGVQILGARVPAAVPPSGAPPARPVWSYHGAPSQEVAPVVLGGQVFLCEDGLEKDDGRVRRLSLSW
jgi:hypothetical protein